MAVPINIGVIGKTCLDMSPEVNEITQEAQGEGAYVKLNIDGKVVSIRTDGLLSAKRDKVTALDSITESILKKIKKSSWNASFGGGGLNSAVALARNDRHDPDYNYKIRFVTPSHALGMVLDEVSDLKEFLLKADVSPVFWDEQHIHPNLVFLGNDANKNVIRSSTKPADYRMDNAKRATISDVVSSSQGILINALAHSDAIGYIVGNVNYLNRRGEEPERKLLTVLTGKTPLSDILRDVVPYSGIVSNKEEFLEMFGTGNRTSKEYVFELFAQIRSGYPNGRRIAAQNETQSIYVTDGPNGYYMCKGEEVWHVKTKAEKDEEIKSFFKRDQVDKTGVGDACAAGFILYETKGRTDDVEHMGAKVHEIALRSRGFTNPIFPKDIEVRKHYLKDHRK